MERKRLSFLRLRLTVTTLSAQSAVGFIPDRCVYWGMWRMAHPANSAATRRLSAFSEHTSYDF